MRSFDGFVSGVTRDGDALELLQVRGQLRRRGVGLCVQLRRRAWLWSAVLAVSLWHGGFFSTLVHASLDEDEDVDEG